MTTPQTFAITVPHSSSQLALGRCACPDGASLTTVGSVLVDAAGTLTAQSGGPFIAQTNAAMSWLSQSSTQVHTPAGVTVYAGGGTAPGACGSGAPADSPGATKPAETTEKVVNVTLSAASLGRNVVDAAGADNAAGVVVQALDAEKNVRELSKELGAPGGDAAPYFEAASGAVGVMAGILSGDFAGALGSAATVASGAAGAAGAAGAGADLEERAVNEIKMVAGTMITGSAGVGYDYKTLNKFGVTAGALTSFTTTTWGAFCLLKFEVKAGVAVKAKTARVSVHAKVSATMDAKAALTVISPKIDYVSKLKVTETLTVKQKTTVNSLEVKNGKTSNLDGTLTVNGNMVIEANLSLKKKMKAKAKVEFAKKIKASGAATVGGKTEVA